MFTIKKIIGSMLLLVSLVALPLGVLAEEDDFFSDAFEEESVSDDGFALDSDRDPWEGFNRKIFVFNETLDRWVLRPVSVAYQTVTPQFANDSVTHFFDNLGELTTILNDLLQLEFGQAGKALGRFAINTTLGFFGLFDVATKLGIEENKQDFGQTLAYWGVNSGPYLMLPFLGPSTVRDAGGFVADWAMSPESQLIEKDRTRYIGFVVEKVDQRADLLKAEGLIFGDKYTFIRDAYLQRRDDITGQTEE